MRDFAFKLYVLYLISFFLHMAARVPVLGLIRIDLILVALIGIILFVSRTDEDVIIDKGGTTQLLKKLIIYIVVTIPLVEWPGSVLSTGLPGFVKAVIFFYFTILLVTTDKKLKILIWVFLLCQIFRVLEPLYLNITDGYWGSRTYVGAGQFEARLGGAPSDIINPNELGYVILTVIILLYYLALVYGSFLLRLFALGVIALCVYALLLTASRSAFLALAFVLLMIFWFSKRKIIFILITSVALAFIIPSLSDFQRERYLSIFSSGSEGSGGTAQGRITGLGREFDVGMNRPIVGHGLGTSKEAKYHFLGGRAKISHNLYLEVLIELGFVGLLIYLLFLKSIIINVRLMMSAHKDKSAERRCFIDEFPQALLVLAVTTMIFSFAQYGLSIYAIYFIAGLSVVLQNNIFEKNIIESNE